MTHPVKARQGAWSKETAKGKTPHGLGLARHTAKTITFQNPKGRGLGGFAYKDWARLAPRGVLFRLSHIATLQRWVRAIEQYNRRAKGAPLLLGWILANAL